MIEKNEILSPTKLWQDFNPVAGDSEISITSMATSNGKITTELMFTAKEVEDGKIRAYLKIVQSEDMGENPPVILIIPGVKGMPDDTIINKVVDGGFVFATFEYAGIGDKRAEYTASTYYGNFDAIENIIEVNKSAKNTCWYLWATIARKAITVLTEQLANPRICLIGENIGANVGWIVAGMDARVDCFVPINGSGYIETMAEYYKPVISSDYPTSWLAGLAMQAYAKHVTCPVFYVGGSNNRYSDIDKAQDILAICSSLNKHASICQNAEDKITTEAFDSIKLWIDMFFTGEQEFVKDTEIGFKVSGEKLYLTANTTDENVVKVRFFVAKKENNPSIREWNKMSQVTALSSGEYLVPLEVDSLDDRIYCFANTYYKDGLVLSSRLVNFLPSECDEPIALAQQKTPPRIIYNTSMCRYFFYGDNGDFTFDRSKIVKRAGAYGVLGIGLEGGGNLYTFKVGAEKYREGVNATLQMDAYASKDTTIEILVYNLEDGDLMPYKVSVFLANCDSWQQIKLTSQDFKNYEMISLDSFKDIKKIELKNIGEAIFNNMIWV